MKGGGINKVGNDSMKIAQAWFKEVSAPQAKSSDSKKAPDVDAAKARKAVSYNAGFAGMSRFGDKAPDFSLEGRIAAKLSDGVPSDAECQFLALATRKLGADRLLGVVERLLTKDAKIVSHYKFREILDRDENLAFNQAIRQARENIAYKDVNFDIDGMSDDEFWARIDMADRVHDGIIENNAAVNLFKMAEKLGILDETV
ncbi:MAG: hypothetical protein WC683_17940 [bacterium]